MQVIFSFNCLQRWQFTGLAKIGSRFLFILFDTRLKCID